MTLAACLQHPHPKNFMNRTTLQQLTNRSYADDILISVLGLFQEKSIMAPKTPWWIWENYDMALTWNRTNYGDHFPLQSMIPEFTSDLRVMNSRFFRWAILDARRVPTRGHVLGREDQRRGWRANFRLLVFSKHSVGWFCFFEVFFWRFHLEQATCCTLEGGCEWILCRLVIFGAIFPQFGCFFMQASSGPPAKFWIVFLGLPSQSVKWIKTNSNNSHSVIIVKKCGQSDSFLTIPECG